MKDFVSFTMKNIHPFDVFYRNRSASIQTCNLQVFAIKIFKKTQKEMLQTYMLIS